MSSIDKECDTGIIHFGMCLLQIGISKIISFESKMATKQTQ